LNNFNSRERKKQWANQNKKQKENNKEANKDTGKYDNNNDNNKYENNNYAYKSEGETYNTNNITEGKYQQEDINKDSSGDNINYRQVIDKPIELFYNKGNLVYGPGYTNEGELANFQSKDYLFIHIGMLGLNLENMKQTIHENLNEQIGKLKIDVGKNNRELSEYISKLKVDMKDAVHLKIEAGRELDKIRDEIERKKVTNILYEDKLSSILEKHAPHNNLHIPISEVHPLYDQHVGHSVSMGNYKLRSEEEFIEINQQPMSRLAQAGKTFITKSEFVPIDEVRPEVYSAKKDIVNYKVGGDEAGNNFRELYSKLNEITELNNRGIKSNYNTMAKNYEVNIHSNNPEMYLEKKERSELIPENNALLIQDDNDFPFDESLKLA
jgi:hypothetical protein